MSFLLGKAAEVLFQPAMDVVIDKWKYFWSYKIYVNNLEHECKHLKHARHGLEHEVEEARDNAVNIEKGVTEWIVEVDKVIEESSVLQEKKKFIINPYKRYKLGKEADDQTQSIQKLETKRRGFGRIYYRTAPGKVMGSYSGISYYATSSRNDILKQINKALMDPCVKVVGVYGPSGVGKSTLLRQVVEQVLRRSLDYDFADVAMATVSQDPNHEKIQDELAFGLGLKFENENGVGQKAVRLSNRLEQQKKNILIILDDIWKKLELETLGIDLDKGRIKLLLTSRREETLMDEMNCQKNFELKALCKEEAMELFEKILGRQIEDKLILELVGKEVAEECACLPVYVVPLAAQLKKYDVSAWRDVLDKLRKSNKLQKNKLIEEALKNEEAKKLFLLCGQIGNQIIAIEDLFVYGMSLGLFEGIDTIEEGRERIKSLLENLKSFCFLEDYGGDYIKIHDAMSEISLSMASKSQNSLVLRDEKQLRDALPSKERLKKCKSISLPFVGDIPSELLEQLECPNVTMFLSYNNEDCRLQFPDSFFEKMSELKVLDIFGASFSRLPSSIKHLSKLHTLSLDRCKIDYLEEIRNLKKLQVLTLRGSELDGLPREVGELTDLRLLDLSRCHKLQVIEPGALAKLVKLEELYLPENFEKWETRGHTNASLDELTGMSCLQSLSICIPEFFMVPHDFPFGNLKRFKILIKAVRTMGISSDDESDEEDDPAGFSSDESDEEDIKNLGKGKMEEEDIKNLGKGKKTSKLLGKGKMTSKDSDQGTMGNHLIEYDRAKALTLKLDRDSRKIILEDSVQNALHRARKLNLKCWTENEETITELAGKGFSELKDISAQYSPGIKYIFRPNDGFQSSTLESLDLSKLPNLEKIYQGNLLANSLTNLRILRIKACHKLKALFSLPLARGLSRIEEIEVSDCKKLSRIVAFCEVGVTECKRTKAGCKIELLVLKGLRKLILSNLPQFSGFCSKEIKASDQKDDGSPLGFLDGRQVSFPLLESLSLSKLPKLKGISQGKYPLKLQRLRFLEVKGCEGVVNIVEKGLNLMDLEELTVESCKSIETIFNLEKSSTGKDVKNQVLEKLMKLKLIDLNSLETIWRMNTKESSLVPNLNQLEVSRCHKLTHLFSSLGAKSLQNISQIFVDDCKMLKMIFPEENDREDSGEIISFSSLKELRISNMENLKTFASGDLYFDFPCLKKLEIKQCQTMSTFLKDGSSPSKEKSERCTFWGMSTHSPLKARSERLGTNENDDGAHCQSFFSAKVILPNLEKLVLSSLGDLKSIWQTSPSEDSFGKLISLEIEKCPHLQTLLKDGQQNLSEIISSASREPENVEIMAESLEKPVLGFPYLTNLKVGDCEELGYLFYDATARTLFQLENLHVSSCQKMFAVVSIHKEEMMMFHKLRSLKLSKLPSLGSFSTGSAKHYFPFLKELWISECKLEAFIKRPPISSPSVKAPPLFDDKVIIPNMEELHIKGLELISHLTEKGGLKSEEIANNEFSVGIFTKLKVLEVEKCNKLPTVISHFILPNLQGLESLTVNDCESMMMIFEFGEDTLGDRKLKTKKFGKLKTLKLRNLPSLEHICGNESFAEDFPFNGLNILEVQSCRCLKNIFTVSTVTILEKLQELRIRDCESMNQVIEWIPDRSIEGTNEIIFPRLSFLRIYNLPELGSFCGKCMTSWPSLTQMEIECCASVKAFAVDSESYCEPLFLLEKVAFPKLEALDIYDMQNMTKLWNISKEEKDLEHLIEAFPKLKILKISSCDQLSTIFPSKMVREVQKLEELTIEDCKSIKQVFQLQGLRSKTKSIDDQSSNPLSFSLKNLTLRKLESLDCLWNIENEEGIDLSFDELQKIVVYRCSLQYLFPVSMVRYLSKLEKIYIRRCENILEIVKKEGSSQFVSFPKVTTLILKNLLKLKRFITCCNFLEWPSLKFLEIHGCPEAKIPVSRLQEISGGCDNIAPFKKVDLFSKLKSFDTDMEGLQEMQSLDGLENVANLCIEYVNETKAQGFPWKLLEHFHSLEILLIYDSSFEELFQSENEEVDGHAKEDHEEVIPYRCNNNRNQEHRKLKSLRELRLVDLEELKQVYREDSVMARVLDMVKKLEVSSCNSLKNLFSTSTSFSNLAMIEVVSCDKMEYLLTASAARCLGQLTILHVWCCVNIEEIVSREHDENGNREADKVDSKICFPHLKELDLSSLPKLKSFSSSESCSFEFCSLESICLEEVSELEVFCKGGFIAPILHDVDVSQNSSIDVQNKLKTLMELDD